MTRMTPELKEKMRLGREAARIQAKAAALESDKATEHTDSAGGALGVLSPLSAIRRKCLDCHAGSFKSVKYCPCDGIHSLRCALWPYRLGMRPGSAIAKYGRQFLTPKDMPDANTDLEKLP